MYLNPDSPVVQRLKLPRGFNVTGTPLVTFRRVDTLLIGDELIALHRELYNPPPDFKLISDEAFWALSSQEYVRIFTDPANHYGTLVISTGGHWTTTLFSGFRDDSAVDRGYGIDGVIEFFGHAMEKWGCRRCWDGRSLYEPTCLATETATITASRGQRPNHTSGIDIAPSPRFRDIHLGIDHPARLRCARAR
ncbi:hypothetical protein EV122DRAFT_285256 [Schizophyllum commune]